MATRPTYEELEQRVKELGIQAKNQPHTGMNSFPDMGLAGLWANG